MMNKLKAFVRHLWLDASDAQRKVPPDMLQRLRGRIAASEQRHSGEIRLCVEASLPASYLWRIDPQNSVRALARQRAVTMFGKLRVWNTEHNNGVLIYMLLAEHAIEIVADRGVAQRVSTEHWQAMVAHMAIAFRENRYEDGLTQALEETSAVLMTHFALTQERDAAPPVNPNELPDDPLLL